MTPALAEAAKNTSIATGRKLKLNHVNITEIVGELFSSFTEEQKQSFLYTLLLIAACDSDGEISGEEIGYFDFYCKVLNYNNDDVFTSFPKIEIEEYILPLQNCDDFSKASMTFIYRGMANIDKEASLKEMNFLKYINESLKFNLEQYLANQENKSEFKKFGKIFNQLIFPKKNNSSDNEYEIIKAISNKNISIELAKEIFYKITFAYELAESRTNDFLKTKLTMYKIEVSEENLDILNAFLSSRILKRLLE